MSDNKRDRRMTKIRHLLLKAQATSSVPEAEALSEMAEKLMIQAGIDEAELNTTRPTHQREEIITLRRDMPGRWGEVHIILFNQIMNALGTVKVIKHCPLPGPRSSGKQIWVIGFASDVETAYQLGDSLLIQALAALSVWESTPDGHATLIHCTPAKVFSHRRAFVIAFALKAAERVKHSRHTVMEEATPGSALAVASRASQVAAYVTANHQHLTSRRTGGYRPGSASEAGAAAGQHARTGQTELRAPRALRDRHT